MLVNFKASESFVRRLDVLAKSRGMNRTQAIKAAVAEAAMGPEETESVPDRPELLRLLGEAARGGSVTAMKALLEEQRRDGDTNEQPAASTIDELAARRTGRAS